LSQEPIHQLVNYYDHEYQIFTRSTHRIRSRLWSLAIVSGREKQSSFDPQLIEIDTTAVNRIIVNNPKDNGATVELNRTATGWTVTKEGGKTFPARLSSVNTVLAQNQSLKAQRIAAKKSDKWAEFEVDDAKGSRVQFFAGSKQVADLIGGKFSFNPQTRTAFSFIRKGGEDNVYVVDGFVTNSLQQSYNEYRNNVLLQANATEVESLQLDGAAPMSLTRSGSDWNIADGTLVDSTTMAPWLGQLQRIQSNNLTDQTPSGPATEKLTIGFSNRATPVVLEAFPGNNPDKPILIRSTENADAVFESDSIGLYKRIFQPGF